MARKIRSTAEAIATAQVEGGEPEGAVVFLNNHLNREFIFSDKTKYKFRQSREVHTDPNLIKNLRALAGDPNQQIFIEPPPQAPDEPEPAIESTEAPADSTTDQPTE